MTQNERILALLDVGPATTADILREVPCIVHSRVAELRKRGYDIRCEQIGARGAGAFLYTLHPLRERTDADPLGRDGAFAHGDGGGNLLGDATTEHGSPLAAPVSDPNQLSFEEAAA